MRASCDCYMLGWIVLLSVWAVELSGQESSHSGTIIVNVPPSAIVYANDRITHATGASRRFVVRGMKPHAQYKYTIRVLLVLPEERIEVTQSVVMEPGAKVHLDFTLDGMRKASEWGVPLVSASQPPKGFHVELKRTLPKVLSGWRQMMARGVATADNSSDKAILEIQAEENAEVSIDGTNYGTARRFFFTFLEGEPLSRVHEVAVQVGEERIARTVLLKRNWLVRLPMTGQVKSPSLRITPPLVSNHLGSAAFSNDSQQIVFAGGTILDRKNGKVITQLKASGTKRVVSRVHSSTNRAKVLTSSSVTRSASLWDAKSGAFIKDFVGHEKNILRGVIDSKETLLVTGSFDEVIIWNVATGEPIKKFAMANTAVAIGESRIALAGNSEIVVCEFEDLVVRVKERLKLNARVSSLAFNQQGNILVATVNDGIRTWNLENGRQSQRKNGKFTSSRSPWGGNIRLSPDLRSIVRVSQRSVDHIELATGKKSTISKPEGGTVTLSPDGRFLLVGGASASFVVDVEAGVTVSHYGSLPISELKELFKHEASTELVARAVSTRQLTVAAKNGVSVVSLNGFRTSSTRTLRATNSRARLENPSVTSDGELVICRAGKRTYIWHIRSGQLVRDFDGTSYRLDASGRFVCSGIPSDPFLRIWDIATGDEVLRLSCWRNGQEWLAMTPDGLYDGSKNCLAACYVESASDMEAEDLSEIETRYSRADLVASTFAGKRMTLEDSWGADSGGIEVDPRELEDKPSSLSELEAFLVKGDLVGAEAYATELRSQQGRQDEANFQLGIVRFLKVVQEKRQRAKTGSLRNYIFPYQGPQFFLGYSNLSRNQQEQKRQLRQLLTDLVKGLGEVESTLATVRPTGVKIPLHIGQIRLDYNGDGVAEEDEALWRKYARLDPFVIQREAEQLCIAFDDADAVWLRAHCNFLMGIGNLRLAYSFFERDAEGRSILKLIDKTKLQSAQKNFSLSVALARQSLNISLEEKDDDKEWLPNPNQHLFLGDSVLDHSTVKRYQKSMSELEAFFKGTKVAPYSRMESGGFSFQKFVNEAGDLDLTSTEETFQAYLEKGEEAEVREIPALTNHLWLFSLWYP